MELVPELRAHDYEEGIGMTHISDYRYGYPTYDSGSGRKSGEVRVSYFDPETGKPCATKPKPRRKAAPPSSFDRNAKRTADIAEAKRIEEGMRERKKARQKAERRERAKEKSNRGNPKAVMVDGVRFETVNDAAEHLGTHPTHLGKVLHGVWGSHHYKGRKVWFADQPEPPDAPMSRPGRPRAVMVDGVRFATVTDAAAEIGVDKTAVGKALKGGRTEVKGRRVEYAEVER